MSAADLYIALWLLSHSVLCAPHSGYVCCDSSTSPLCTAQISSASLPLFGSLYDGDYPLPPAQGFPDWFFSYRDRTSHEVTPAGDKSSDHALNGATSSIFTFYPDRSPSQTGSDLEACHDNAL